MRIPRGYGGPLLVDNGQGPVLRLTYDQKSLSKQIVALLTPIVGKSAAKSQQTAKLIATLIVLLDIEQASPPVVHLLFKHTRLFQLALEGKLVAPLNVYKPTNRDIKLIGMDNYNKTTCYLDALIMSMFHSTGVFDFLLDPVGDPNLSPELQTEVEELKVILRYLVNLIRSGHHINTSIMYQLLLVLNSLGCEMALSGTQQDSLQMFVFLVECLSLPLLTFKLAVIHHGKLNVADDLRLIEERILLIPVPSNSQPNEPPIDLQDCLDKYFNNSVTVRRMMDKKLSNNPFAEDLVDCDSTSAIADEASDDHDEMNEYERQGILKSVDSMDVCVRTPSPTERLEQIEQSTESLKISPVTTLDNSPGNRSPTSPGSRTAPSKSPTFESIMNFAVSVPMDTAESASFRNVTERLSHQRTRSSTLMSKLNNVIPSNPSRVTRRPSSISNTEVSLPAWMYMQILPYYADPNVKLTVENHEDFYRSRTKRSKTIDSSQYDPKHVEENQSMMSPFERRFGGHRPIVPICLKKYTWNERGQSVKIKRKVNIPEIIMYPFFIAEDRTKIGFVDFKRSKDLKSPCGSFMLVLQSCVCHRGSSVNSGHYVSISRKHRYLPNLPNKDEWVLFNDVELPQDKAKTMTFAQVMDTEDPYILFYEIVELISNEPAIVMPSGSNDHYWSGTNTRKPSVVSSLSDGTIVEEHTSSILDNFMALSKSKPKNEYEDVLDEYWFNSDEVRNASMTTTIHEIAEQSCSSIESGQAAPRVVVREVNESVDSTMSSTEGGDGIVEYEDTDLGGTPISQASHALPVETLRNTHTNKSYTSLRSKETLKPKKKGMIGKLIKKVFT